MVEDMGLKLRQAGPELRSTNDYMTGNELLGPSEFNSLVYMPGEISFPSLTIVQL